MLVHVVVRPFHDKQPRQDLKKDTSHPRGHCVGLRRTEVNVEDDHSHAYAGYLKPRKKSISQILNSNSLILFIIVLNSE